jgi:HSP20 family protein
MSFLMKPDPFSSEVNRLFNTLFAPAEERTQRWSPAMDLVEAEDHYLLRADLPGMAEEDVAIEIQDNVLTVSGERRDEQEQRRQGWHRVERTFGRFSRSLTLREGIDPEAVKAEFDKGVLSITVPKPEQRKPRRVQISVGGAQPAVEGASREHTGGAGDDAVPANGGPAEQAPAADSAASR